MRKPHPSTSIIPRNSLKLSFTAFLALVSLNFYRGVIFVKAENNWLQALIRMTTMDRTPASPYLEHKSGGNIGRGPSPRRNRLYSELISAPITRIKATYCAKINRMIIEAMEP